MQGENEAVVEALRRGDLDAAPVEDADRALLQFVRVITEHAWKTTDETVQRVRDAGWTDPQIAEGVYIAALFAFFNRVADAFGIAGYEFGNQPSESDATDTTTGTE